MYMSSHDEAEGGNDQLAGEEGGGEGTGEGEGGMSNNSDVLGIELLSAMRRQQRFMHDALSFKVHYN